MISKQVYSRNIPSLEKSKEELYHQGAIYRIHERSGFIRIRGCLLRFRSYREIDWGN
jgi:hypothetical protein